MSTESRGFQSAFDGLKVLLERYQRSLDIKHNDAGHYYLDTYHIMANRKPLFFGAVKIGKSYVSYHLMPVYVFPDLLSEISPALRRHMQGKSCFNFRLPDNALFDELDELTRRGYSRYCEAGYVETNPH